MPEKREEEVRKLKEAIEAWKPEAGQEEVQFSRKDGPFLLRFLRARKFNTERALQLYVNFHFYRAKHAKLLGDLNDVESVRYILDSGLICVLDQCSRNGCKVCVCVCARTRAHVCTCVRACVSEWALGDLFHVVGFVGTCFAIWPMGYAGHAYWRCDEDTVADTRQAD